MDRLLEAQQALQVIEDKEEWEQLVSMLAPHLSENLLNMVVDSVLAIDDKTDRAQALLLALLPHLPEGRKRGVARDVLNGTPTVEDEDWAPVLITVLHYLPEEYKNAVVQEALAAISAIKRGMDWAQAFVMLAPYLPENLKTEKVWEAFEAAQTIPWKDPVYGARVMTTLVPLLPEALQREGMRRAFEDAVTESSESYQAQILAILIPYLPVSLLPNVLVAVKKMKSEQRRAQVLTILASRIPEIPVQDIQLLVQEIKKEEHRVQVMGALASHLSEASLQEILLTVRSITAGDEDTWAEVEATIQMFPSLPKTLIKASLGGERRPTYKGLKAEVLTKIVPYLSEKLKCETVREALQAAQLLEERDDRARVLAEMTPHLLDLPPVALYALWRDLLHLLAHSTRPDLLTNIRTLTPIMLKLGGPEVILEISRVILAVGEWWS